MSRKNVEVVQRIWGIYLEGLRQGDPDAATAVFDQGLVAPESTYTPIRDVPGTRTYVGREGFSEFFREWTDDWTDWTVQVEEVIDAGDDRVVAIASQSGTGRGSGAAVEVRFGMVYTLSGGQVVDRFDCRVPEALEAAGRSE
jgi:ketosteroid isomerase-like protein